VLVTICGDVGAGGTVTVCGGVGAGVLVTICAGPGVTELGGLEATIRLATARGAGVAVLVAAAETPIPPRTNPAMSAAAMKAMNLVLFIL
jgi:hypothetical protein